MNIRLLAIFIFCCVRAQAQETKTLPPGVIQLTTDQMQWTDGAATLPKGTKVCLLYGDHKKEGPFAMRLRLPPNQTIRPHIHTNDEVVTVLEGEIMIGLGEMSPSATVKRFPPKSFYVNPAGTKHYVMTSKEGAVVQINTLGPWTISFE